MRRLLLPLACALLAAPAAAQQRPPEAPARLTLERGAAADPAGASERAWPDAGVAVAASALLPGAGQWLQGQRRWVPYLALEAWSWVRFRERRSDARHTAERYRDLAWSVARRVSVGARRDTVFEYYEAMADPSFGASGAFDASPLEGIQPEGDTTTFNGSLWKLSRDLFIPAGTDAAPGTPAYEHALAYYRQHAIPAAYAWAWGASALEKQVFTDLIAESDDAYRDGTRMLSLILANHIASAVDALITARLHDLARGRAEFESGFSPGPGGPAVQAALRVRF